MIRNRTRRQHLEQFGIDGTGTETDLSARAVRRHELAKAGRHFAQSGVGLCGVELPCGMCDRCVNGGVLD